MNNKELISDLFKDDAFVKELLSKESAEEAQALLESRGAQVSLEDVKELGSVLEKAAKGEIDLEAADGELSEEALSNVAGGELSILAAIAIGTLVGSAVGGGTTVGVLSYIHDWRW